MTNLINRENNANLHDINAINRAYIEEIKKIPFLTESEERELVNSWCYGGDVKAAQALVKSHLRLVVKVAFELRGYGVAVMDLISEGSIGLMTAVRKFKPEMKVRFATYASWWVRASMQNFILKSWSLLKVNSAAVKKKLFYKFNKNKDDIKAVAGVGVDSVGCWSDRSDSFDLNEEEPGFALEFQQQKELETALFEASSDDALLGERGSSNHNQPAHAPEVCSLNKQPWSAANCSEQLISLVRNPGEITTNAANYVKNELTLRETDPNSENFMLDAARNMVSLNKQMNGPGIDEEGSELINYIADSSDATNPERALLQAQSVIEDREILQEAFHKALNQREAAILALRRLQDPAMKLELIAKKFGISSERVRQIENKAFSKLQNYILAARAAKANG